MISLSKLKIALSALGIGKKLMPWDEWTDTRFHVTSSPAYPLVGTAISGGTTSNTGPLVAYADGLYNDGATIRCGTTANSGYRWMTGQGVIMFGAAAMRSECVIRPLAFTNTTVRMGYHDTVTSAAPVDGAWIEIDSSGNASGKTSSNSVSSSTASNVALTLNVAYVFTVKVNADATLASFEIRNATTNALIWQDTINSNIPPKVNTRLMFAGFIGTNSGTVATDLFNVHWFGFGTESAYWKSRT